MINPFNGVALAGASHRVFCSVIVQDGIMESNNTLTVMWTRGDGGMLLSVGESFGSHIFLSPVRTSHGGQYTCTTRLNIPEAGVDVSGANTTSISIQCTHLHHYHSLYDVILSSLILPQLFLHLRLSLDPPGIRVSSKAWTSPLPVASLWVVWWILQSQYRESGIGMGLS